MFERFSERSRLVVVVAQDQARRRNHDYVGTEHMLLALLNESTGGIAGSLASFGVTPARTIEKLAEIAPHGKFPHEGHLPFTPRCKKALEYALRIALVLGHEHIAPEHLLLGMLEYANKAKGEPPTGVRVLRGLGVNLSDLQQFLIQQVVVGAIGQAKPVAYDQGSERPERLYVNLTVLPRRLEILRTQVGVGDPSFKLALANFLEHEAALLREEAASRADAEDVG